MKAVNDSTDEQVEIKFKAFTLKSQKKNDIDVVFEVIINAFAIELIRLIPDIIKKYTFYHCVEEEETEHKLFFICDKSTSPPTEEALKKIKAENTEKAVNEIVNQEEIV
jgi:hypothetical protein